ncbi:hypothetical protein [Marinobacterium sp. xm-d-530]|uniref:hypothetical protein n=1 Tax=Marinobacterium sp. xm-d-530 TaxID=2497747 RepID=UPI00156A4667|nr:hypothetical protein [Marinobacterium sp. xm-d-530]NRQ01295.1 hypothetical protein [Marinobacterium sp. xm-d-530]
MNKFVLLIPISITLMGCIKSAEVRNAESNLESFERQQASRYISGCTSEAARLVPVRMERFRPDPPSLQNCGYYTDNMSRMICEQGNQNAIALNEAMSYKTYDANEKQRAQVRDDCVSQLLNSDPNYVQQKSLLLRSLQSAEDAQASDPLKAFGFK